MSSAKTVYENLSVLDYSLLDHLSNAVSGFGASYAIGRSNEPAKTAFAVAVGGKISALALIFSDRDGLAANIANSVGQAGINAIGLEMGLRHARAKTGKKLILVKT